MESWTLTIHLATLIEIQERAKCLQCVAVSEWSYDPDPRLGELWVMKLSEYNPNYYKMFEYKRKSKRWARWDQRNSVVHELIHNVIRNANEEAAVAMLTNAINP